MRTPDWATLDPPGQPGETVSWCPLCGDVIYRRAASDQRTPLNVALAEEEAARDHMLVRHDLDPETAVAKVKEALVLG